MRGWQGGTRGVLGWWGAGWFPSGGAVAMTTQAHAWLERKASDKSEGVSVPPLTAASHSPWAEQGTSKWE